MENEVDKFLEGLDNEPKPDPFEQSKGDPFAADEPVDEAKEEEKEEKPLPFHKDPKVQKFIDKEISKRMADIKPAEKEAPAREIPATDDSLTDVLARIIGNDTPEKLSAIKEFRRELGTLEEKGAQKALREIEERSAREREAERAAERELAEGLDGIEEKFDVDLTSPSSAKLRDDFLKFMQRLSPKDENGQVTEYPDFQEAFSIFRDTIKPQPNSKAKELSSRSMARSSDASKPADNGDRSWKSIDRIFSNMK